MLDTQTQSLWSHILGEAMKGPLKGTRLTTLPSDMMTWSAWRQAHPNTTVLAMSRTRHQEYTDEFYRDPSRFVVGFLGGEGMQHCSFATLKQHPLLNVDAGGVPLLVTFDPETTSVRIWSRAVDGKTLTFEDQEGQIRDRETGSTWDRLTGKATSGPNKGKSLAAHVGIVSYARAWQIFHPDSREVK